MSHGGEPAHAGAARRALVTDGRPTADVVLDLAQGPDIGPGWINANVYGRQC